MSARNSLPKLFLFGAPRLEVAGRPAALDTRKSLALFAYLTVQGGVQAREKLAALFWPDSDTAKALGALRRTLSVLNRAVGGAGLLIERESVAATDAVWVDVLEFRRLTARPDDLAAQGEAAHLANDDFLAGFTLRDSPPFDDWQFFQTEALRRELAGALERLVTGLAARGEAETALGNARRWVALDPLHEPAQRQLMTLYARTGRRAAALRQYQECVRVLQAELGVAPLPATTQLYEALRANRQEPEPLPAPRPAAEERAPARPLVGRAAELGQLRAAHTQARTGGRLVLLEGEAGLGKTCLAEAFLHEQQTIGVRTMAARCYAGQAQLAYGPWVEALRAGLRAEGGAARLAPLPAHQRQEVARLLPELAAAAPPAGPGAQARFFEGVRQAVLALLAGAAPGVLLLDDAQWADDASLELLTYLVRRLAEQPLLIVVIWRGPAAPAAHALRRLLAEARRAHAADLVSLRRLSPTEVRAMAEAVLGPAAAPALVERLYRETEGLPLFVAEYLAALAQSAGTEAGWELPASVREVLAARLAAVDEAARQVVAAAAVIGRSFDLETVQAASGRSDDETAAALETLTTHNLIVELPGPAASADVRYDFSHDKLRALVYDQTSLARRRLLHGRVAEALLFQARRAGQLTLGQLAASLAEHFRLGGRPAEAAEYFRQAGDVARAVYANTEALAHYRTALRLGHAEVAALQTAIGDLQTRAGDYPGALASYEAAAAAGGSLFELEQCLANVYDRRGEWEFADSHFRAAQAAAPPDGLGLAGLYAAWSRAAQHAGREAQALELAEQALTLAAEEEDDRALARAHNLLGLLASRAGRHAAAREHLEASLALARQRADPEAQVAALNNLAQAGRAAGDWVQSIALTEQALALCAALGDRHQEAALRNNLADLLHAQGQREAAMAQLKQAVTLFTEIGGRAGPAADDWQAGVWKLTEW